MAKKIEINEEELKIKEAMDSKIEEITELQTTKAEIEALYKAKLETLKAQYEEKVQGITANIDFKMQELKSMFGRVSHKATKTQEKVSLLGGDVVLKKASMKFEYDKDALLEEAKKQLAAGNDTLSHYIQTKTVESFAWSEFKDTLTIAETGEIIDKETGEIVNIESLKAVEVPEEFLIK